MAKPLLAGNTEQLKLMLTQDYLNRALNNWAQGVIARIISKSDEREARGRFQITSTITPWIVRHEVQLQINRNCNKIREEHDSGIDYLTGWCLDAEKDNPIKCNKRALDDVYCPITQAWRVQLYNYGWNQGCWWPIRLEFWLV